MGLERALCAALGNAAQQAVGSTAVPRRETRSCRPDAALHVSGRCTVPTCRMPNFWEWFG